MILESIVTTVSKEGQVNVAPMGPVVSRPDAMRIIDRPDPGFRLRPFEGSRTFENLVETRCATIHVTDDVELFASAAVGHIDLKSGASSSESLVRRSPCERFAILQHCHRWFCIEVTSVEATPPRYEMECRVIDSAMEEPFFGFNRAKHAVIEAAILATRTHLIGREELFRQLETLKPLVDKTAGAPEQRAFEMLAREIDSRIELNSLGGGE